MNEGKEIKYSQDSKEWHEWRSKGLGASDMNVIMGALPFKYNDVLILWKKKTKLIPEDFVMNEAMQAGKDLEPEARTKYSKASGIRVRPKCFEHIKYPFIRASLDGISKGNQHIVEIKCQGMFHFQKAKKGIMTEYYYPQIQSQMLSSGAQSAHFWTYRKKEGGVLMSVPRNDEYIEELIRRATIFWEGIVDNKPVLPIHLGINMFGESDPFQAGEMKVELIGHYKN